MFLAKFLDLIHAILSLHFRSHLLDVLRVRVMLPFPTVFIKFNSKNGGIREVRGEIELLLDGDITTVIMIGVL